MKRLMNIQCLIILAILYMGCNERHNQRPDVVTIDSTALPVNANEKTLYFKSGLVYYNSMDIPGKEEAFRCVSLYTKKPLWSKYTGDVMGINAGVIISTGEYVVPTLSDNVYVIDAVGNYRVVRLEDRCKINPLVYKNTFILQDRGVGLKCFDAKTLQQLWLIKQQSNFTMSQPMLFDGNIIYIIDDNSIQSSNVANGELNWKKSVEDSLSIQILYGMYKSYIFVLATDLKQNKFITAIDANNGNQIWTTKVDSAVDIWETSMIAVNNTIFCKGDSVVITLNAQTGKTVSSYKYKSRLATNLIADKNENLLFGLEDNTVVKIAKDGTDILYKPLSKKLNRFYNVGDSIYLYCYPTLYLLGE